MLTSKKIFIILSLLLFVSCDCGDSTKKDDEYKVKIQMVGSEIEGLRLCSQLSKEPICKKTDSNGMVEFKKEGNFTVSINEMNISTIEVKNDASVYSPYQLFENDEDLAKKVLLLFHAFDKSEDISDEKVSLSFSKYIPKFDSIEKLIKEEENLTLITYDVNEHNISIDWEDNTIIRDDKTTVIEVPTKEAYAQLNDVAQFVYMADDKNVTMDNLETKYHLKKETLTRFSLGDAYILNAVAKDDKVVIEVYNKESRVTDEVVLLKSDDNNTLVTDYFSLNFKEE